MPCYPCSLSVRRNTLGLASRCEPLDSHDRLGEVIVLPVLQQLRSLQMAGRHFSVVVSYGLVRAVKGALAFIHRKRHREDVEGHPVEDWELRLLSLPLVQDISNVRQTTQSKVGI